MKLLQISLFSPGTQQHPHLWPTTCVRPLSYSLMLLQKAWHRRQEHQRCDEYWSPHALSLILRWSGGRFRRFQSNLINSSSNNMSSTTHARGDNTTTHVHFFAVRARRSLDKHRHWLSYLQSMQVKRSFQVDLLGEAAEEKLMPAILAVARPANWNASIFPPQLVAVTTKSKDWAASSDGVNRLHWAASSLYQTMIATSGRHVQSFGKLVVASSLESSRRSTTSSTCYYKSVAPTSSHSVSTSSSSSSRDVYYWASSRSSSSSNTGSNTDMSRISNTISSKASRATRLSFCYGMSRSSLYQQELNAACLKWSEKNNTDVGVFHFVAETPKTWVSVAARLRSNASLTGAGRAAATPKTYYTFVTTAVSKPHNSTVEEGGTAGVKDSLLCSKEAQDSYSTAMKAVRSATIVTRQNKMPGCPRDGPAAAADGRSEVDNAAAEATGVCHRSTSATLGFGVAAAEGGGGGKHVVPSPASALAAGEQAAATPPRGAASATVETGEKQRKAAEEAGARARDAETLWDTLVPERHWGLQSPMFWVLLALVLLLHAYNNKTDKEKAASYTDEDKAEKELREEVDKRRQERSRRQREEENTRF